MSDATRQVLTGALIGMGFGLLNAVAHVFLERRFRHRPRRYVWNPREML